MSDPTRIMLDIETLGLDPGAAILSIAACAFNTEGVYDTTQYNIDLESCQEAGLTIDADTLDWWLRQDEAVTDVLTGGIFLRAALLTFAEWYDTHDPDEVWANSPKFDAAMLEAAYDAVDESVPWDFHQLRDVRTVRALPGAVELEQDGVEHDALDDAVHQARAVAATLRALEEQTDG